MNQLETAISDAIGQGIEEPRPNSRYSMSSINIKNLNHENEEIKSEYNRKPLLKKIGHQGSENLLGIAGNFKSKPIRTLSQNSPRLKV